MLGLLAEPKSIAELVAHRIEYRHHVDEPYVQSVERHPAERHLSRLAALGAVVEVEPVSTAPLNEHIDPRPSATQ